MPDKERQIGPASALPAEPTGLIADQTGKKAPLLIF